MKQLRHAAIHTPGPSFFLFALCILSVLLPGLWGCCCTADKPASEMLRQSGVSRELASERKKNISDPEYRLHFFIPEDMRQPVTGKLHIVLSLNQSGAREDLILDFKEDSAKIRSLSVNGSPSGYIFKNEHIIIPFRELKEGVNEIIADFIAGEQSLNRNEDYLYTLLVPDRARTLFPCFDQPDLKACYELTLTLPEKWEAVANSKELPGNGSSSPSAVSPDTGVLPIVPGTRTVSFAPTEPLSTYLFSFVAGNFQKSAHTKNGREIHIFHRETEPAKLQQLDTIAAQVFASLSWMEEYTGIPYPFSKYDLIILPGFQFGGMEHTGATLYNDGRMFLPPHPTLSQQLSRTELIAHETAHMWFGDLVTMDWFSGVWIKEVFANFFASRIIRPLYPNIDYSLNNLNFYTGAYSEDRTGGTTSIQQELPNLQYAGLIYGQIIYQKSPVVMNMLYERMGKKAFQEGIREYLNTYKYGNAGWDDLIRIFAKYTSPGLEEWSRTWIYEKGMPEVSFSYKDTTGGESLSGSIKISQSDRYGRDIVWPQSLELTFTRDLPAGGNNRGQNPENTSGKEAEVRKIRVYLKEKETFVHTDSVPLPRMLPNLDGKFYGYLRLDTSTVRFALGNLYTHPVFTKNLTARKSMLITLRENYLRGNLQGEKFLACLKEYLDKEQDRQLFPTLLGYIAGIGAETPGCRLQAESILYDFMLREKNPDRATQAFKYLPSLASSPELLETLYEIWHTERTPANIRLSEDDFTGLAYQLAVKLSGKEEYIVKTQRSRIKHPDKLRKFDFISRAVAGDTLRRDSLFNSLLLSGNRTPEPWVQSVLSYLNHPDRQKHALKYIRPALEEMEEIQRTGDIFFPKGWIGSVLGGHRSEEALRIVSGYLEDHPSLPLLLKNKILQSSDHLERAAHLHGEKE